MAHSSQIFQIDCEVDTGASCNILPLYKAKALFGDDLKMGKPTGNLKGYNDSPVENLGSCIMYLYHGNRRYRALSRHLLPTTKDYLLQEYADMFQSIGTLPGGPYRIQLKEDYKPVQHPPRQVAVSLKAAYKSELRDLSSLESLKK